MTYQDLFVTPVYLIILYGLAFWIRPRVTDVHTKRYLIPALSLKFLGAIMIGVIYQFYYGGGDTFTYFRLGSYQIWRAFLEKPDVAFSLIFGDMEFTPSNFDYASRIFSFGDSSSFSVVRLAGFFDLFTFHTYTSTALLFASLSFSGVWMLYVTFLRYFPAYHKPFAYTILFVPSLFFWGSGILKDTLTLGAIGWLFYGISGIAESKNSLLTNVIIAILGAYVIFKIKVYILICFLPAVGFWFFINYQKTVKNMALKILIVPVLIAFGLVTSYYSVVTLSESNSRYSIDNVLYTAEETAKWIHFVSDNQSGSSYSFGDYDFSPTGLLRKFIPATATTFFRPFLWEVRNPVMLLSALENSVILGLFLMTLFRFRNYKNVISNPILLLCIIFSVGFGFAVGVSTYNFGSLVRYKIPMMPFLITALYLISRKKIFS